MKSGFYPVMVDMDKAGSVAEYLDWKTIVEVVGSDGSVYVGQVYVGCVSDGTFDFGPNPKPIDMPEWCKE